LEYDAETDTDGVAEAEMEGVGLGLGLTETEGLAVALALPEGDLEGLALIVADGLTDNDGDAALSNPSSCND
jgi:hypothetical protein